MQITNINKIKKNGGGGNYMLITWLHANHEPTIKKVKWRDA